MGSSLGSSGLAAFSTLIIAASAIILIYADSKVRQIPGYGTNETVTSAHNYLVAAQIAAWAATFFSLVLTLGYVFKHNKLPIYP